MPYIFSGPIDPASGISAEQSTNIGQAIQDATEPVTPAPNAPSFVQTYGVALIGAAAGLTLLVFARAMRD